MAISILSAVDFHINLHGELSLVSPITQAARAWVEKNVPKPSTTYAGAIVIEQRYLDPIVEAIKADGLGVAQ